MPRALAACSSPSWIVLQPPSPRADQVKPRGSAGRRDLQPNKPLVDQGRQLGESVDLGRRTPIECLTDKVVPCPEDAEAHGAFEGPGARLGERDVFLCESDGDNGNLADACIAAACNEEKKVLARDRLVPHLEDALPLVGVLAGAYRNIARHGA